MSALTTTNMNIAISITTLQELQAYCAVIAKTEMIPKAYQGKPDNILVAVMQGQELGLKPLQALQSIAVINGIPSIYGDAGLSLVRSSGLLAEFEEWLEIDGQKVTEIPNLIEAAEKGRRIVQWCKSRRKDSTVPRITTYSVTDAKIAKLWLKKKKYPNGDTVESPWCTSPARMLMFRCRGFNLRDEFGDVLKGTRLYEEAMDFDLDMEQTAPGVYQASQEEIKKPSNMGDILKANAPKTVSTPTAEAPVPTPSEASPEPPPSESVPPSDPPPQPEEPKPEPEPSKPPVSIVPLIQDALAKLSTSAKGTALVAGIRKMFKLKPDVQWPDDVSHHPLFLNALKDAEKKL